MAKKKMHMICNAHLDYVWQWKWDESVSAALSTFRAAADFCEEYDGFVFNHNEAVLYEWIEQYEPELFERIKRLVKEGKWNIIGGWYLQPDCLMPSGESFVRQILLGRSYFKEKFGAVPTTAVNFDSFGHTKGLVQILTKSGFDSYVFMRPDKDDYELAKGIDFVWEGFDGSKVTCHKILPCYNSLMGQVQKEIDTYAEHFSGKPIGFMPWGVGNHGGGPSRMDLNTIAENQKKDMEFELVHSTPEAYFAELKDLDLDLPVVNKSLVSIFVGCYTSQIRIKQKHRELENLLYSTEKMASAAAMQNLMEYPEAELRKAMVSLATSEFHDILPGTSIQTVEEEALDTMAGAISSLKEIRTRAFYALASGQEKVGEGVYPIAVYNPHPFPVKGIFECEFMLADQNWEDNFTVTEIYHNGKKVNSQLEKEGSALNLDWRKKVAFEAVLEPSSMNRFDCHTKRIDARPVFETNPVDGKLTFENDERKLVINAKTGLIDSYEVGGVEMLKKDAFKLLVVDDIADSWRMDTYTFDKVIGEFELMTEAEGAEFCGIDAPGNIRIVNDGDVRTIVEAYFKYKNSALCISYKIPKQGSKIQIDLRVYCNEKDKMFKLSVPTAFGADKYIGQTAFGIDNLQTDGKEAVSQKWSAAVSETSALYVVNNGVYGSSFENGEMRISLLRSASYCAHPIPERSLFPDSRFMPRFDQGERTYSFWLDVCTPDTLEKADRDATIHNEWVTAVNIFPSGSGKKPEAAVVFDCDNAGVSAFKKASMGDGYVLRLYENSGKDAEGTFDIPSLGIKHKFTLSKFEVKTFIIRDGAVTETDLVEGI